MDKELSQKVLEEIWKSFDKIDKLGRKRVTTSDVIKGTHLMGIFPTELEEKEITEQVILDEEGLVSFEEYTRLVSEQCKEKTYEDRLFMEAFHKLDKDKNGYLDKEEFRMWLKRRGKKWTEDDENYMQEIFEKADVNKDGKVIFKEFVNVFCEPL